jgi:hypothetical protein
VVASTRNGMASFGILGASLGLGLGLAGGLLRGSARSAGLAGVVGLVLGGGAGAVMAKVLVPIYFAKPQADSLTVPLLVHGGIWSAIGVGVGLAYGLGIGGHGRKAEAVFYAVLYAVVGSLLATFVYEFAGVLLFPTAQADRPLPISPGIRLFADLVVSLVIGASLVFGVPRGPSSKVVSAPTVS